VRFESCACDVLEATIWLDISFMHVDVYEIGSSLSGRLLVLKNLLFLAKLPKTLFIGKDVWSII
jgi:hypothetical protein